MGWVMHLAPLSEMWSKKWHQCMPFGCINNVVVAFACHFVAPHCHTFGIGYASKNIKNDGQFSKLSIQQLYANISLPCQDTVLQINKIGISKYL